MACRVADACGHAELTAKLEIGAAIPPRVFRSRVLVASVSVAVLCRAADVAANQRL